MSPFGPTGLLSRHAGSSSIFYAFDPQGNPAEELNASDGVTESFDFDAYGNRSISGTATDPYSNFGSQYGYYSDSETGLELLGYRYYDPSQGRFVNRDPIGMAGGVNVYGYTQNGPVDGADADGLQSKPSRGKGNRRGGGRNPGFGNDPALNPKPSTPAECAALLILIKALRRQGQTERANNLAAAYKVICGKPGKQHGGSRKPRPKRVRLPDEGAAIDETWKFCPVIAGGYLLPKWLPEIVPAIGAALDRLFQPISGPVPVDEPTPGAPPQLAGPRIGAPQPAP